MENLKAIYKAATLELAEQALKEMESKWKDKYPYLVKSWKNNWARLAAFLRYPQEVRHVMYTTNIIESIHSQFRKITKSKREFPSDEALLKLLYLIYNNIKQDWSTIKGWKKIYSQLFIIFEERMQS